MGVGGVGGRGVVGRREGVGLGVFWLGVVFGLCLHGDTTCLACVWICLPVDWLWKRGGWAGRLLGSSLALDTDRRVEMDVRNCGNRKQHVCFAWCVYYVLLFHLLPPSELQQKKALRYAKLSYGYMTDIK